MTRDLSLPVVPAAAVKPAHVVVLEVIRARWVHFLGEWCDLEQEAYDGVLDDILRERAYTRMAVLEKLLDDLLDLCVEHDWPIPLGINCRRVRGS